MWGIAVFVVSACGTTHTQMPIATMTKTVTAAAPSTQAELPTTAQRPGRPQTSISSDGTYLVGVDIVPGMYRTTGGSACYWARLSSLNTSDIIDNNNSAGPQVIEIQPTDKAFLTHGCQSWTLAQGATPTATAQPLRPAPAAPVLTLPDADGKGFFEGPRCELAAVFLIRTAQSAAAVCAAQDGTYTYEGRRLSDNARITLPGATPTPYGFTVTNPADGTRYDIRRDGLTIYSGGVAYSEPAVESAP